MGWVATQNKHNWRSGWRGKMEVQHQKKITHERLREDGVNRETLSFQKRTNILAGGLSVARERLTLAKLS